jgi:hypothetical protein
VAPGGVGVGLAVEVEVGGVRSTQAVTLSFSSPVVISVEVLAGTF